MTVKQLITELLEMPLDAEVEVSMHSDTDTFQKASMVVNYEDGTIGVVGTGEIEEDGKREEDLNWWAYEVFFVDGSRNILEPDKLKQELMNHTVKYYREMW